ncbi:MAG: RluA family pseudouridine synthase [Treponema sp.]|jgi:23S rRNA pseudouridine1911/1915/1917 synthase|nr:RluA family pseudouridine synthase [Treponema sp.]
MGAISCIVGDHCSLKRLDRYISENIRLFTRSQIKTRGLKVKVNGKNVKLSRIIKPGDFLELEWEDLPPDGIIPQNIPLDIVYEDERCIVINKQQGLVVHPGAGNRQGTLANAIYYRKLQKRNDIQKNINNTSKNLRAGIVHRLDKETSGLIICAYDDEAHHFLSEQFKTRKVKKTYLAIVQGRLDDKNGRLETFIARDGGNRKRFSVSNNGKFAVTLYKALKTWDTYSLVLLRPKTGRTHQLRLHMKYLGHPVLGDALYGRTDKIFPDASLMLHSKTLEITIPGENEARIFTLPVPKRFMDVIYKINN